MLDIEAVNRNLGECARQLGYEPIDDEAMTKAFTGARHERPAMSDRQ